MDAPIVIFVLAGQRLALPAASVRECLPLPLLRRRPGSPQAVAGMFELGGTTLPVIDLAVLLGLRMPSGREVLAGGAALEQDGLYRPLLRLAPDPSRMPADIALLVDRLERVALPDAAPDTGASDPWQHGCVLAHVRVDGAPVALLDPARLLLEHERARLDQLLRQDASRDRDWADDRNPAGDA